MENRIVSVRVNGNLKFELGELPTNKEFPREVVVDLQTCLDEEGSSCVRVEFQGGSVHLIKYKRLMISLANVDPANPVILATRESKKD